MLGRKRVTDPELGELVRRRGRWRGHLTIAAGQTVPLTLGGGWAGPDPGDVALARSIPSTFATCQPALHAALADHRAPYRDGPDEAEPPPDPIYAAVMTFEKAPTIEVGYRVPWDEEHTLGARLRDGQLIELCGSVIEP